MRAKALVQFSIDAYPRVLGVHFVYDLVPFHLHLTNNEAIEQRVGLQVLRPCKFAGSLHIFLDCGELLLLLILLTFCLTFLGGLKERF